MKYPKEYEYWKNYKHKKLKRWIVKERLRRGRELEKAVRVYTRTKYFIGTQWRECSKCWEYKLWSQYSYCKTSPKGFTSNCKECRNEYKKKYRENKENVDRENEWKKEYRKRNPEKVKEYNLYYKAMKNNIEILKKNGDRPRSRKKAKYDIQARKSFNI